VVALVRAARAKVTTRQRPTRVNADRLAQSSPEEEATARQRLGVVLQQVDGWSAFLGPEAMAQSGSSLAGDDMATDPHQISHSALRCLGVAVDHMQALRDLILKGQVLPIHACYTLLRAALENAATVVWLLGPTARNDRVTRQLRNTWANAVNGERVRALIANGDPYESSLPKVRSRIKALAAARQISTASAMSSVGTESIVAAAQRHLGWEADPGVGVVVWRMCSGIAHGDLGRSGAQPTGRNGAAPGGC